MVSSESWEKCATAADSPEWKTSCVSIDGRKANTSEFLCTFRIGWAAPQFVRSVQKWCKNGAVFIFIFRFPLRTRLLEKRPTKLCHSFQTYTEGHFIAIGALVRELVRT